MMKDHTATAINASMKRDELGKGRARRFLGTYRLPLGQEAVGELKADGPRTLLRVHSSEFLQRVEYGATVTGVSYSGEHLTLIRCHSPGSGQLGVPGSPAQYHADIFPHFIAAGRAHIQPESKCVVAIHFSTSDLSTLFYDFDAFGHVIDSKAIIDVVLSERRAMRPVEAGDIPEVAYFTGKERIAGVATSIGDVVVRHRPSYSMGGPSGVFIKNKIVVSIESGEAMTFDSAIERMFDVWTFLSMAAGRRQGLEDVGVTTTEERDGLPAVLTVLPSFGPKAGKGGPLIRPHPGDVPFNPIDRPDEFRGALVNWIDRHKEWHPARGQYLACLGKANKYSPDRLVAAANMFDILPATAFPPGDPLPADLMAAKDECVRLLRAVSPGIDRDGALSALGRLGKPSLPKKVAHRTALVEGAMAGRFTGLQVVTAAAVKLRNFYVHGATGDLDVEAVEPFMSFLTGALEFVFAASDLIEAGWDAKRWASEPMGWGHNFSRFRDAYRSQHDALPCRCCA